MLYVAFGALHEPCEPLLAPLKARALSTLVPVLYDYCIVQIAEYELEASLSLGWCTLSRLVFLADCRLL